jgi:hypothetical protein
VFPDGSRTVNTRGLDFYKRLIDALLDAGIQPWMTLFHWDLPQWAEDEFRGWESKRCAKFFADFAATMERPSPAPALRRRHPPQRLGMNSYRVRGCARLTSG